VTRTSKIDTYMRVRWKRKKSYTAKWDLNLRCKAIFAFRLTQQNTPLSRYLFFALNLNNKSLMITFCVYNIILKFLTYCQTVWSVTTLFTRKRFVLDKNFFGLTISIPNKLAKMTFQKNATHIFSKLICVEVPPYMLPLASLTHYTMEVSNFCINFVVATHIQTKEVQIYKPYLKYLFPNIRYTNTKVWMNKLNNTKNII